MYKPIRSRSVMPTPVIIFFRELAAPAAVARGRLSPAVPGTWSDDDAL
jgi:hypothetical protein